MIANKPFEQADNLADHAAQSADQAIRATQRVTHDALDSLAGTVQDVRQQVSPLLQRANEQTRVLTQRGVDAVRDSSQKVREQARHAGDSTVQYVRAEPVKAVLIAAATGAALMALVGLMSRSRDRS